MYRSQYWPFLCYGETERKLKIFFSDGLILKHINNATVKYKLKDIAVVPKRLITMDIVFTCEQYWNIYENRSSIFAQCVLKLVFQVLKRDLFPPLK